ncbi:MAG: hypothetical protein AAF683_07780 [Pseudomonadota bacterium]
MVHRCIAITILFVGTAGFSHAQNVKLVCEGIGLESGVSSMARMMVPEPNVKGVLIEVQSNAVTISGHTLLRGKYEVDQTESDEASYTFISEERRAGGTLNRYSGDLEMFLCKSPRDCEEIGFHFVGTCSKQERLF